MKRALLLLALLVAGCAVVPKVPPGVVGDPHVLAELPGGARQIDAIDAARYARLVKTYGALMAPRLTDTTGLTPRSDGTYVLDREHWIDFCVLADLERGDITP